MESRRKLKINLIKSILAFTVTAVIFTFTLFSWFVELFEDNFGEVTIGEVKSNIYIGDSTILSIDFNSTNSTVVEAKKAYLVDDDTSIVDVSLDPLMYIDLEVELADSGYSFTMNRIFTTFFVVLEVPSTSSDVIFKTQVIAPDLVVAAKRLSVDSGGQPIVDNDPYTQLRYFYSISPNSSFPITVPGNASKILPGINAGRTTYLDENNANSLLCRRGQKIYTQFYVWGDYNRLTIPDPIPVDYNGMVPINVVKQVSLEFHLLQGRQN
jgi:hypothetical protein